MSYRWTSQRTGELEGSNKGILGSPYISIKGQDQTGIRNIKFGYRYSKTKTSVRKAIRGMLLFQKDTEV